MVYTNVYTNVTMYSHYYTLMLEKDTNHYTNISIHVQNQGMQSHDLTLGKTDIVHYVTTHFGISLCSSVLLLC